MRIFAVIAVSFVVLVLQAAFGMLGMTTAAAPNLIIPIILYLGVSGSVSLVVGTMTAFGIGYLHDFFCGNPLGLQTLVSVAIFIVAKTAGGRLFLRGPFSQAALSFFAVVLADVTALALIAIFGFPSPLPQRSLDETGRALLWGALLTAAIAPLVFLVVSRVEALIGQRSEDAPV